MSRPWRKNKGAAATDGGTSSADQPYSVGTYGQKDNGYNASITNTPNTDKDNIPLTSRQRVLDAYNQSS